MSEIEFSCPKCRMAIVCDDSYMGSAIDCPGCSAKMKVPQRLSPKLPPPTPSNQKVTGPAVRSMRKPTTDQRPKWVWITAGSLVLLFLLGLVDPSGMVLFSYGMILFFASFVFWIWTTKDAFGDSVRRGLFTIFVPFYWGRYYFKHCTNVGLKNFGFAFALGALPGLIFSMAEDVGLADSETDSDSFSFSWSFGEDDGSEFVVSSTPREAFNGFQTATKQNDYSSAFKYLAPELQNEHLDMNVSMVRGAQMMGGDASLKRIADEGAAILKKHGVVLLSFEEEFKNRMNNAQPSMSEAEAMSAKYAGIADKGQLYQELANTLKGSAILNEEGDFLASLASSPLTEPSILGTTARGEGKILGDMKIAVHFKQTQGTWLISEIEMLDLGELIERFNQQMNQSGMNRGSRSRKTAPEVEDSVFKFHQQKAMAGNRGSQYELGMIYLSGKGVEQDTEQAKEWLKMSADQGYSRAEKELARLERSQN